MQGWIKLHRSIMESDTFKTLTIKQKIIAIYIILNVNHKDGIWTDQYKGIQVEVKRGQLITSPQKIADTWFPKDKEITRQVVRTTLDKLSKLNFLTKHPTNDFTLINVVNYGIYQSVDDEDNQDPNQALTKSQPSLNQALTTNKNVKNDKNDKNEKKRSSSDGLPVSKASGFFARNFHGHSPYIHEQIEHWENELSEEIVIASMKIALEKNAKHFNFCKSILQEWADNDLKTIEDVRAYESEKRSHSKSRNQRGHPRHVEPLPKSMAENKQSEPDPGWEDRKKQLERELSEL